MMRIDVIAATMLLTLALAMPATVRADATSECGVAQLKASAKLAKAQFAEGAKACAAGSAGNPAPVNVAKLTAATEKTNAAIVASVAKYGQNNCFKSANAALTVDGVVETTEAIANAFCLAP